MKNKKKSTFSLRSDIKRKLVTALRSGKYKQTTDVLHDVNGYCCLGVLCKVSGIDSAAMIGKGLPQEVGIGRNIDTAIDWSDAWSVEYKGVMQPLSILNDSEKLSFKKIANIIERTVTTYPKYAKL